MPLLAFPPAAMAQKKVALIIGNSGYANVGKLQNPANDATAVTALFTQAGFEIVDSRFDLGIADMRKALRDFSDRVGDADIAVIYFAGHGIEVDGGNYLIPVDAVLERDVDVEDEAISLDRILRVVEPAKRLRLVILDACRDNPFTRSIKRTLGTRSVGRGLAKVEPVSVDTLVAYAAKAGSYAVDGAGQNSPFTTALVKHIATPGLDLRLALGRVRDEVIKSTSSRQEPFVYGSLGGDTVALVPAVVDPQVEARRDYEFAAQIGTKEAWDTFLASHSTGFYAGLARAQAARLESAEKTIAEVEEGRIRSEDHARQLASSYAVLLEELARRRSEQSDLDQSQRQAAEHLRRELDEARRQAEADRRAADEARKQIDEIKRQAVESARQQTELARREAAEQSKVATLGSLPSKSRDSEVMDPSDIARLLQAHLKRVGCEPGAIGGEWNDQSQKALDLFNKHARTKFNIKVASITALDAVRAKTDRVCPLLCARGQRADGDQCVQITCGTGLVLGSDGRCVKRTVQQQRAAPARQESRTPTPSASGSPKCFTFNGKRFCE